MKNDEYLYGRTDVPEVPEEVICRRVELLKEHLDELLEVPHRERDTNRTNDVVNAIRFWENINMR